jgi:hypothetical protein
MWFQFYMLLSSPKTLQNLFNWAPKGSHLSNLFVKLTLFHVDIFALQAINSWSVILGHGVELDSDFFLIQSIKSSFLFKLKLLPSIIVARMLPMG